MSNNSEFVGWRWQMYICSNCSAVVSPAYFGMMYLLTAVGLTPGGSSTVHIYTQTVHRTTQNKQYIEQHNETECTNGTYITIRMRNLQNWTEAYKTYNQNRTRRIWKNVINETATQAANFIWSIYLLIMIRHPSLHFTQLHFTPLHYTCRHFTAYLNFTHLHFTTTLATTW